MGYGILIILAVGLTVCLGRYLWVRQAPQHQPEPTSICGGQFKAIGSKCYYIENDKEQKWLGALYHCSSMDGHLASIKNQQELDDISKELRPNKEYFIDLNDQINDGDRDELLSATTGLAPNFVHQNLNINKILLCPTINTLSQMKDAFCTENMLFVCEKKEIATQEQKEKIEQNFKKIGDKYYYIENKKLRKWIDAFHKCQELGGHLATPRNDLELLGISEELHNGAQYHIDLTDQLERGEFLSISSGLKDNYFAWADGEPNLNFAKDSVAIEKTEMGTFMYHVDINELKYFICEATI
ncbi:uncharacterized protein [Drosophila bipectinata]|uniref:uncharacterized protein n=1 Tax=Drosophila bipectinata TaxID=42026 RepID=UPI0038B24F61